jgi:hypothetical protein
MKMKTQLPDLWDRVKAGLRGNFKAMRTHILEEGKISNNLFYVLVGVFLLPLMREHAILGFMSLACCA